MVRVYLVLWIIVLQLLICGFYRTFSNQFFSFVGI